MKTKRILALILLILSVFFFIASLAGIAVTWVYNVRFTEQALVELGAIQTDLALTQSNLKTAQENLESAQAQIDIFQAAMEAIGLDAMQNTQVLAEVVGKVEGTLTPILDQAAGTVGGFRDKFVAFKDAIESLNDLPLVNIEIPGVETIDQIAQNVADLQTQILETKQKVEDVSTLTQETVETFSTGFANWETTIQENLVMLDNYSSKVSAYQARVDDLLARVPGWLDWAAVILTVFLVWLAFSQVGLFVLAWEFYKGEDLLARWLTQG
jgi:ABC-type transporter Mla subunit MlaD